MTDDYRLHDRLGFRLSRLSRLMQARLEQGLAPIGLTRSKWCILSGVGLEGLSKPSELAAHIGITRPATSRLLRQMLDERLLIEVADPEDRRAKALSLTPAGMTILEQARTIVDENDNHFRAKLTGFETDHLAALLARLADGEDRELDHL